MNSKKSSFKGLKKAAVRVVTGLCRIRSSRVAPVRSRTGGQAADQFLEGHKRIYLIHVDGQIEVVLQIHDQFDQPQRIHPVIRQRFVGVKNIRAELVGQNADDLIFAGVGPGKNVAGNRGAAARSDKRPPREGGSPRRSALARGVARQRVRESANRPIVLYAGSSLLSEAISSRMRRYASAPLTEGTITA
jgi:hypothetical protein